MGLLDQVLGQVLGGMSGGGAQAAPGGQWNQNAAPQGGGMSNMSPLVMALLALVASRTLNNGAGGIGSKLHDMLTGGTSTGGGIATGGTAPGGGGSFLDQIGGMLGGGNVGGSATGGQGGGITGGGGGLGGLLGSVLGGGAAAGGLGGLAGSGLGGLLERFAQNGQGNIMQSWINSGSNQPIAPTQLDQALGPQTVDELSEKTGLGRDDLLQQLSHALPGVVDGLTPHGRLPEQHEEGQWI